MLFIGTQFSNLYTVCVCVYYCRTYYKAVRGGGRRRVEDMCYERRRAEACVDESAHHALGTLEEPGTLTQGAPVFPGSSRLGIEPKTPGWLVQDPGPTTVAPG